MDVGPTLWVGGGSQRLLSPNRTKVLVVLLLGLWLLLGCDNTNMIFYDFSNRYRYKDIGIGIG